MRYAITGEHRSAYDRTTAEAHDVALAFAGRPAGRMAETPAANHDAARAGPCAGQGADAGVLRADGYPSGARRADRGRPGR
jgi:hypothetical protein